MSRVGVSVGLMIALFSIGRMKFGVGGVVGGVSVMAIGGRRFGVHERVQPVAVEFEALYRSEVDQMMRLAMLLTGRPEAARDIVQEAFIGLYRRWKHVDNPGGYLRRSVVNGTNSYHRKRRVRREVPLGEPDQMPSVPLEVDETYRMLDCLNERQRACVVLKFYEGRTEAEIATIVGCRPGSVGPTLQRALAVLREVHEQAAFDPPTGGGSHG